MLRAFVLTAHLSDLLGGARRVSGCLLQAHAAAMASRHCVHLDGRCISQAGDCLWAEEGREAADTHDKCEGEEA